MHILVTGASGFIGGHAVDSLLAAGHEVRAIARIGSKTDPLVKKGVDVWIGAISDSSFLRTACEGVDVVLNLSGRLGGWGVRPEELLLVNLTAVKKLFSAAEARGVRQFVHCSTPGVLGFAGIAAEDLPYNPTGYYEATKCEAEKYVLSRHSANGLAVTVARPDFVYGPRDLHKLKMFRAIQKDRFPTIRGGKSLLHPTYVSDVSHGLNLMIGCQEAYGKVFNIAGPATVTVKELVMTVSRCLKMRGAPMNVPLPIAWSAALVCEAGARVLNRQPSITRQQVAFFSLDHGSDITRARSVLGYEPKVGLDEGIARTVGWYRQEGLL
jgi:nucleoside-diphosphate-sugar epimerase